MKVLFVGLGSIGIRNLRACQSVRPDYQYFALRSGRGSATSSLQDSLSQLPQVVQDIGQVRELRPDIAWICNPTHAHASSVRDLAESCRSFFIEKPLAHTTQDLNEMEKVLTGNKALFFYGCVMRHHPVVQAVKELLDSGTLGRVLSYTIHCGSYLPDWRPHSDYRKSYSAKKSEGGGVHLDLIHEFDFAQLWFGRFKSLSGYCGRVSDLELDSNDLCLATSLHDAGARGQISLNYFERKPRRTFEITLSKGTITGDLIASRLSWTDLSKESTKDFPCERDDLYRSQARQVFEVLEKGSPSPWNLKDAAELNRQLVNWVEGAQ